MYRPSLPDAPTTQIRSSAGRPAPPWCCASCLVSRSAEPAALRIVSSVMHSDSDGFRLEVSRPTLTSPQGYPLSPAQRPQTHCACFLRGWWSPWGARMGRGPRRCRVRTREIVTVETLTCSLPASLPGASRWCGPPSNRGSVWLGQRRGSGPQADEPSGVSMSCEAVSGWGMLAISDAGHRGLIDRRFALQCRQARTIPRRRPTRLAHGTRPARIAISATWLALVVRRRGRVRTHGPCRIRRPRHQRQR